MGGLPTPYQKTNSARCATHEYPNLSADCDARHGAQKYPQRQFSALLQQPQMPDDQAWTEEEELPEMVGSYYWRVKCQQCFKKKGVHRKQVYV
jgi:hypothetical protein